MRGQVTAFRVAIICGGVSDSARWAKTLQALAVCSWATSRSLNNSLNRLCWLSVKGVSPCMDVTISSPSGAASKGITSSSNSSLLSVLGHSAMHMGSLMACITLQTSASAIWCITRLIVSLNLVTISFITSFSLPAMIQASMRIRASSREWMWRVALLGLMTPWGSADSPTVCSSAILSITSGSFTAIAQSGALEPA